MGEKIKSAFQWKCREQCSKRKQSNVVKLLRGQTANEANVVFAIGLEKSDLHKHSGGDQR